MPALQLLHHQRAAISWEPADFLALGRVAETLTTVYKNLETHLVFNQPRSANVNTEQWRTAPRLEKTQARIIISLTTAIRPAIALPPDHSHDPAVFPPGRDPPLKVNFSRPRGTSKAATSGLLELYVNCLFAAKDQVRAAQSTDSSCQGIGCGPGIGPGKSAVRKENSLVSTESQSFPQSSLCLRRPHGQNNYFPALLLPDPQTFLKGIEIKGIDDTFDPFPLEIMGDGIQPDILGLGNLFNTDDDFH
jgi:hypothetical protein